MHLCVRRSIQITNHDFEFSGNSRLEEEDLSDEFGKSRVYSSDVKRSLATVLSRLVELCICLTQILSLVYPSQDSLVIDQHDWSNQRQKIKLYRKTLGYWEEQTRCTAPVASTPPTDSPAEGTNHIILFSELLWVYYKWVPLRYSLS